MGFHQLCPVDFQQTPRRFLPFPYIQGHGVVGENVHIEAVFFQSVGLGLQVQRAALAHLAEGQGVVGVCVPALPAVFRFQFLRGDAAEFLIILPQHSHVHVVVPRNEPLMAHRAQKGAAGEKIGNVVFLAHPADLLCNFQLGQLYFSQQFPFHMVTPFS